MSQLHPYTPYDGFKPIATGTCVNRVTSQQDGEPMSINQLFALFESSNIAQSSAKSQAETSELPSHAPYFNRSESQITAPFRPKYPTVQYGTDYRKPSRRTETGPPGTAVVARDPRKVKKPASLLDLPLPVLRGIIQATDYQTALRLAQTHRHFRPPIYSVYSYGDKRAQKVAFVTMRAATLSVRSTYRYCACSVCFQVFYCQPGVDPNFKADLGICRQCAAKEALCKKTILLRGPVYDLLERRARFCIACGHIVFQFLDCERPIIYCPCIKGHLPGVDLEVEAHKAEEFEKDCEEFQIDYPEALPTSMKTFNDRGRPPWVKSLHEPKVKHEAVNANSAVGTEPVIKEFAKQRNKPPWEESQEERARRIFRCNYDPYMNGKRFVEEYSESYPLRKKRAIEKEQVRIDGSVMFTVSEALALYKKQEEEGFLLDPPQRERFLASG